MKISIVISLGVLVYLTWFFVRFYKGKWYPIEVPIYLLAGVVMALVGLITWKIGWPFFITGLTMVLTIVVRLWPKRLGRR